MSSHYKAFLVVMVVTTLAFWLARPAFTRFMSDEVFVRRRNLWLGLTVCAFLIPSFWGYMGIAAVLIWRAGRSDPNPAALYLFLLLVVPPFQETIPGFGVVNQLFALDNFRLLSLVLLAPAAFQMRRQSHALALGQADRRTWLASDILLIVYCGLQVALIAPYVSVTVSLRSSFLLGLDLLLPYYVISRCCTSKQMVVEAIAAFALSAVVLAPLAVFETAKGWLMYAEMGDRWQIDAGIGYLLREGTLRAQVTSGQSIILGNFYVVVLGLWLYLQSRLTGWRRWLGTAAVVLALLAAYSRGPWVGAVVCGFAFFAVGPDAKTRALKAIGISALIAAAVLASPLGNRIIDSLPFIGTVDAGNITYRQEIVNRLWFLIQQNPLFGSPYFSYYMEDLRQGQGIIDLLNVYLSIGAAYGLVTMVVFVSFLGIAAFRCLRVVRVNAKSDVDTSRLGAAMFASLAGTMVIMYTVSNYLSIPYIYTGLAALMVAYSRASRGAIDRAAQLEPHLDGVTQRGRFGLRV